MKNKIFIYAFFSFAILYFCYRGIIYPALNNNDDFGVYYHTALKISNFDLDIYNTKIHTDVFNYPPIFALMLKPIIFFDYQTSKIIWLVFNIFFYLLSILLLLKTLNIDNCDMPLYFSLALLYNPTLETLKWGQINIFILFLIVSGFFLYRKNHSLLSALSFAVAAVIKLSPAIFILFFLIKKKIKIALWFIVFIALFNIISIFVFGKQIVIGYYTDLLPALMHRGMFDNPYNQSFHNLYWRLFKHGHGYSTPLVYAPNIFNILTTLTTYSIFIFSLIFIWKHRTKNDSLILAALLILTLLCSNVSWEHHYSLTIFAFIIVFKFLDENYINKYALIIFCCAYALMSVKIGYDNKLLLRGILNIFVSIRLYSAILLYFIIFLCIKFSKNNN